MRAGRSVALLLLATAPLAAQDGAFSTEPAGCADGRRIEIGAAQIAAEPNFLTGSPRTRWDLPILRGTLCLDARAEFELEWTGRVSAGDDRDFDHPSDFGDVVVRTKLRLAGSGPAGPTLALRFVTALPQTSFGSGLGSNTLRFTAQILVSKPVGRGWLHANAGLALLDEALRAHEQRDLFAYGLQLAWPLRVEGEAPELVVETAGQLGDGSPGTDAHAEARAGLRFRRGRGTWSVALRRGLLEADGTWGVTAFVSLPVKKKGAEVEPETPPPEN